MMLERVVNCSALPSELVSSLFLSSSSMMKRKRKEDMEALTWVSTLTLVLNSGGTKLIWILYSWVVVRHSDDDGEAIDNRDQQKIWNRNRQGHTLLPLPCLVSKVILILAVAVRASLTMFSFLFFLTTLCCCSSSGIRELRFLPSSAAGGGEAPSRILCRFCALIQRGVGSGNLETEGCSESEGLGRFRVLWEPNLAERRGAVGRAI